MKFTEWYIRHETELSYEFSNKIEKKYFWIGTENFLMVVRQKGI